MSVNETYEAYFQAIADALFVPVGEQKNLVLVDDLSDAKEVAIFQNSSGFTAKFLILEKPDNGFSKDAGDSTTVLSGSVFVVGYVDKAMEGMAATKAMMLECEELCKQIFDTMVFDSEADEGRSLFELGVFCEAQTSGNWAMMLNKYWGYRIDIKWELHENLYYGNIIEHNFSL